MIEVDGYKAFRGIMRIVPKGGLMKPREIEGDWLYNPETNYWCCGKEHYPCTICQVIKDYTENKNGEN
jgi:hypothetical protein